MVYESLYNLCVTAGPDKHQPAPRVGHRDQFPQIGGSSVKFPKLQNGRGHEDETTAAKYLKPMFGSCLLPSAGNTTAELPPLTGQRIGLRRRLAAVSFRTLQYE